MNHITTWDQLRTVISDQAINDREEREKLDTMEGWKDDGYSAEWTARRMGYVDPPEEKTFHIYWRNGKKEKVVGYDIADAFAKAGYGGGAINAVDFYKQGEDTYEWNAEEKKWEG